ncbi:SGNH/GDSL hydrolase family protein [Zoogloea sp.]|uniref:SGNH/GDSL hydrolase family protein n=1 Tax=Zoogloea sp. TaxID=49181 RepID=UPI0014156427|nr:MAG: SGNH/GDSL hydrolase family protein [Zoogloea sp.]
MSCLSHLSRGLAGLCLSATAMAAQAGFSSLTFFGDSLSDTGNLFIASGGAFPPPPYFDGRRSDGPVWVEYLAQGLGMPAAATPFQAGGSNYAFIGAQTGLDGYGGLVNVGLQAQVGFWTAVSGGVTDPGGLYVIGIGANDLFSVVEANSGTGAADIQGREAASDSALNNLMGSLGFLATKGARNFLVANVPDLATTPEARALGTSAAYAQTTRYFNEQLALRLATFRTSFAVGVAELDFYGISQAVTQDGLNGGLRYGLGNVLVPCLQPGAPACSDSMYADGVHPTTAMHAIVGQLALATVPEPDSAVLVLSALALLPLLRRRK